MSQVTLPLAQGKLWFDVINPSSQEMSELASKYKLHPAFVLDCLDPQHLPKFEEANGQFFIVRAYDEQCKRNAETIQDLTRKVAVFVVPEGVITIHRADQPFLQKLREKWQQSGSTRTVDHFVNHLLSEVIRSFQPLILAETERLNVMEESVFRGKRSAIFFGKAYRTKRVTSVVEQVVRMTEEVLPAILAGHSQSKSDLPFASDLLDQIRRLIFSIDDLQQRLDQIVSLYLGMESQRNNDTMRVLTIFSAFFLPLTFIAGIYGMNFRHMPELEWTYGYAGVLGLMLLVSFGIGWWFWRKGWLK